MNHRSMPRLGRGAVAGLVLLAAAGCAEFADFISSDTDGRAVAEKQQAEAANLWELTLMAGRYGVMLDQAREILKLPEQAAGGASFPTSDTENDKQRAALAGYQAAVVKEFAIDVGRACARKRVPKKVRALACEQQKKLPAELRAPVAPEMQALAVRNDNVGEYVMTWWDAVCATAPKPKNDDDMPACAME
jgi:hypothetical protein